MLDLVLQIAQTNAIPEKVNEDNGEREQCKKEGCEHIRSHIETALRCRIGAADHNRMDRAEQADGEEGDRRANATDERIDRAETGAFFGLINSLTEHEVGDIDQLGNSGCGEARIPGPPGVPGRSAQMEPSTIVIRKKTRLTSIAATWRRSHLRFFVIK